MKVIELIVKDEERRSENNQPGFMLPYIMQECGFKQGASNIAGNVFYKICGTIEEANYWLEYIHIAFGHIKLPNALDCSFKEPYKIGFYPAQYQTNIKDLEIESVKSD